MTGLYLGLVVAAAVVAGTLVVALIGIIIDRSAARHEREEMRAGHERSISLD